MSDLIIALAEMHKARPRQEEAREFYEGKSPEIIDSPRLARVIGARTPFAFNFSRIPIASRLARLEIASVTSTDPAQQELLTKLWRDNQMDQESRDVHEGFLVHGESYLMVMPGDPDDPTSVDLFFNDATSVRAFYEPENPRELRFVCKTWQEDEGYTRVNLYYPDRTERWVSISKDKLTMPQDADFVPYTGDGDNDEDDENPFAVEPNETGRIPVFHFRTGRPHGRPEHEDAYGPQNAITKLIATQMAAVDYQGLPQRYALQDTSYNGGAGEVDAAFEDQDDAYSEMEFYSQSTQTQDSLRSTPGGVWWLKGISSVGQFDVANSDNFLNPLREYISAMAITTDTPLHAFQVGGQMPSGEARRAAEIPLVKRVQDLQQICEAQWVAAFEYALELMGITNPQVSITWRPAESFDDLASWQTAAQQFAVGVSLRQILAERGYDPSDVEKIVAEAPAKALPTTAVPALPAASPAQHTG